MTTFVINPHGRLQEWIAHEKGYFLLAGLDDYELRQHELLSKATAPTVVTPEATVDNRVGAFQTYEKGRDASVSCACHWTVNMAATADHGRLWGDAYSVSPCAIVVPAASPIRRPEDLADVPVHVGHQSGSHYATIQALEAFIEPARIALTFGGSPADRVDQLLAGSAGAATVFGPQLYLVEQLGYRKVLDCTFMISAMVPAGIELDDVRRYYEALRLAQADIDRLHQDYTHHYLNELPPRHADLIDVRRFGPGERLVFEPYTREMYESTHRWVDERGIFESDDVGPADYERAVIRLS